MVNQIAEKLSLDTGLIEDDIKELKILDKDVKISLKEAMDIAISNVENSDISIDDKNNQKEIIHKNIKAALVLEAIVCCKEKALERNVTLEEHIESLAESTNKALLKARTIKVISIAVLALTFILNKLIQVDPNHAILKLIVFSTITICTLFFGYIPSNMLTNKFNALKNLISEAKKNLSFDK